MMVLMFTIIDSPYYGFRFDFYIGSGSAVTQEREAIANMIFVIVLFIFNTIQ